MTIFSAVLVLMISSAEKRRDSDNMADSFPEKRILSLAIPVSDALILNQLLLIGIVGIYYNFTVYSKSS